MTMNEYQDKMDELSIELGELQAKRDRIEASKLSDDEMKAALSAVDRKMSAIRSERFRIEDEHNYQEEQSKKEFNENRNKMIFENELGSYSKREKIKQEYVEKFPDSELTKDILLVDKEIREGKVPSKKIDISELIKALEESRKKDMKSDDTEESKDSKDESVPASDTDENSDSDGEQESDDNEDAIDDVANNMTDEDMNYILELEKIGKEYNLSVEQVESLLSKVSGLNGKNVAKDEVEEDNESEPEPEEVNDEDNESEPEPEEVHSEDNESEPTDKKEEYPFKVSSKVRIKSINLSGTITKITSDKDVLIKLDDNRGFAHAYMNNLESVDELTPENTEEPEVQYTPENVEEKPVSEETTDAAREENKTNERISTTTEEKPRGLVSKIVNKPIELFKKAISGGINAIKYFLEIGPDDEEEEEEIPSQEEFAEGYSKNVESDSDMMNVQAKPKASRYDTPEQIATDLKKNLNGDAGIINKGIERG